MGKKWVYLFEELEQAENYVGGSWEAIRSLFGGKGANMAEMMRIDLFDGQKDLERYFDFDGWENLENARALQKGVLIATAHSAYDYDFIVQHARLVVDTRNATRDVVEGREKIHKA